MNILTALRRGLRANSPSTAAQGACWHCSVVSWLSCSNKSAPDLPAKWIVFQKSLLSWIQEHWSRIGNVLLLQMLPPTNTSQRFKAASSNQACISHSQLKYCCSHLPGSEWKRKAPPTHTPILLPSWLSCIPHFFASFSLLLPAKVSHSVCAPAVGLSLSCDQCPVATH